MIVVDTSAILAVLLNEAHGPACFQVLRDNEGSLAISAGTLAELSILAAHRQLSQELTGLVDSAAIEVVSVTAHTAQQCAAAHLRWSSGQHGLNFGDTFAYALAKTRNCPLLYVGNDFSQTDIVSAL